MTQPIPRLHLRHRGVWLTTAGLLAVGLVLLGSYARASSALAHVRAARNVAGPDLAAATAACVELDHATADAGPLQTLALLAGLVPTDRARAWAQAPALAQAGGAACRGLSAAKRLLAIADTSTDGDTGAALLGALRADRADVDALAASLTDAADALERVDPPALTGDERFAPFVGLVQSAQQHRAELRAVASFAPRAPDLLARLLGGDRPRTYLLLGQNNDEARATGGFIGTLGQLTLGDGLVVATDVRSSYLWDRADVPKPPAPLPLQRYANFAGWYLRDANWWVDYPRSVAQLLALWDREQGNAAGVDGVIAIDRGALDLLLEAVGGVDVPELGGHVTASSAEAALDKRRRSPEALRSYADYQLIKSQALSALHRAVIKKVTGAHGGDLLKVLMALGRAAQEKHLLVWLRDPDLQRLASEQGWDGRVDPGDGDFLGVVDTTVSYGKVTPYIEKAVDFSRRADGAAVLTITYRNTYQAEPGAAWDPLIDGTWWDWRARAFQKQQGAWLGYVRVLAPGRSRALDAEGWDDAPSTTAEGAVTVFGAPLLVRPGESRTVRLVYADPAPVSATLKLFRQPGAPDLLAAAR